MRLTETKNSCRPSGEAVNIPDCTEPRVTVELFGSARLLAGCGSVELSLPPAVSARDVAVRLAAVAPSLVGEIIDTDNGLQSSYVFNLNGTLFMSSEPQAIGRGDRILLFSSQAGG